MDREQVAASLASVLGINNFRGTQAFEARLSSAVSSSTSVVRKSPVVRSAQARPKVLPSWTNSGEKIVSLGREHPFVEMGARAEDLRDFAFDELAGPRLLHLSQMATLRPALRMRPM